MTRAVAPSAVRRPPPSEYGLSLFINRTLRPVTHVILVDEQDNQIGVREKQRAHVEGALHRAISIFVFDTTGTKMLIQQRAFDKYHSGGLWSNACCTHPAPGETVLDAAHRRLGEELGFDCPLDFAFSFTYRAEVGPTLVEHEFDHVFIGRSDVEAQPDPAEIAAVRWIDVPEVVRDVAERPERYSLWFAVALAEMKARRLL
jgi:isopentenyl-diphosphate Delta-isomerase